MWLKRTFELHPLLQSGEPYEAALEFGLVRCGDVADSDMGGSGVTEGVVVGSRRDRYAGRGGCLREGNAVMGCGRGEPEVVPTCGDVSGVRRIQSGA